MSTELKLSPDRLGSEEIYTSKVEELPINQNSDALAGRKILRADFTEPRKAAFQRVVSTLARVKQDLENKSEKQLVREELEEKLRKRLYSERMQVLEKEIAIKQSSADQKKRVTLEASRKARVGKLRAARLLTTISPPSLTYLPAKLLPELQHTIDRQIDSVNKMFPELPDPERDLDSNPNPNPNPNSEFPVETAGVSDVHTQFQSHAPQITIKGSSDVRVDE